MSAAAAWTRASSLPTRKMAIATRIAWATPSRHAEAPWRTICSRCSTRTPPMTTSMKVCQTRELFVFFLSLPVYVFVYFSLPCRRLQIRHAHISSPPPPPYPLPPLPPPSILSLPLSPAPPPPSSPPPLPLRPSPHPVLPPSSSLSPPPHPSIQLTISKTDSTCTGGISGVESANGNVCCDTGCGICDGVSCVGYGDCCEEKIQDSGVLCSDSGTAPCILDSGVCVNNS